MTSASPIRVDGNSIDVRSPRVLHVSNRWGGGVKTVVRQYVEATPGYSHFLLRGEDPWAVLGSDELDFDGVGALPSGVLRGRRALKAAIDENAIDIVHAHSSYAGALLRMTETDRHVVYTPHAFATLAPRGSKVWLAGQGERLLGLRSATFAAVSDAEAELARRYSPRSTVVRIVNLPNPTLIPQARFSQPAKVVMCGRICTQKGADFFAETARQARRRGLRATFEWLGDGDARMRTVLLRAGVSISGWLGQDELHRRMATATLYLHSARYEGACLSVLDAAALGVPSIGRPVPGVKEVSWMHLAASPRQAAKLVETFATEQIWQDASARAGREVRTLTQDWQREQLLAVYSARRS